LSLYRPNGCDGSYTAGSTLPACMQSQHGLASCCSVNLILIQPAFHPLKTLQMCTNTCKTAYISATSQKCCCIKNDISCIGMRSWPPFSVFVALFLLWLVEGLLNQSCPMLFSIHTLYSTYIGWSNDHDNTPVQSLHLHKFPVSAFSGFQSFRGHILAQFFFSI